MNSSEAPAPPVTSSLTSRCPAESSAATFGPAAPIGSIRPSAVSGARESATSATIAATATARKTGERTERADTAHLAGGGAQGPEDDGGVITVQLPSDC